MLLMILDHSLLALNLLPELRILTRPAMPVFMMLSGHLFTGRFNIYRIVQVLIVACFVFALSRFMGWPGGVLVSWLLCWPLMPLVSKHPFAFVLVGYSLSVFFVVPGLDYHPGLILLFLSLGRLIRMPETLQIPFFSFVGRYPLSFYSIHFFLCFLYLKRGVLDAYI